MSLALEVATVAVATVPSAFPVVVAINLSHKCCKIYEPLNQAIDQKCFKTTV